MNMNVIMNIVINIIDKNKIILYKYPLNLISEIPRKGSKIHNQ